MTEVWALLYLHDWGLPKEEQEHKWEPGKNVFPEIHGVYPTLASAGEAQRSMLYPDKYWIRRVHIPAVGQEPLPPVDRKRDSSPRVPKSLARRYGKGKP